MEALQTGLPLIFAGRGRSPCPSPCLSPLAGRGRVRGRGSFRLGFLAFVGALTCAATAAFADDPRAKPLGDVPIFHEEALAAGINSVYDGPWEFFVGGGGAAFDCDGSGFPSVFLAGGKNRAKLYVNKSKAGGPLKFEEKPLDIGADPSLLDNVIGATRSTSTATATWTCSCCGWERTCCSKAGPTARSPSPTRNGASTATPAGRLRSPPNGRRARNSRPSPSAITSTATRRARHGARAKRIRSIARNPATSPTTPSGRRWRRASARCRCCSPTGTARARRHCASPTTGNIIAAAKSRCGESSPARRRASTDAPTAGGMSRSSAWASPRATSTARASRNMR